MVAGIIESKKLSRIYHSNVKLSLMVENLTQVKIGII